MTRLTLFSSSGSWTVSLVDDRIFADVVAGHGHQRALRRVHVEPLRKEHVDLVDVLL